MTAEDEKRGPPGEVVETTMAEERTAAQPQPQHNSATSYDPRPATATTTRTTSTTSHSIDSDSQNYADDEEYYDDDDDGDSAGPRHPRNMTHDDLLEAQELADKLSLMDTRDILARTYRTHERDPNFPLPILQKIRYFLDQDALFQTEESVGTPGAGPATAEDEKQGPHAENDQLIREMKVEAALITTNSPYAEVRAVVDNKDNPNAPSSTIRAWVIGLVFSLLLAFINQLFDIRQPTIRVMANVAQLLAYPLGKAAENWLPDKGFTLLGIRHSLNPGPFHKKEHMLITIMANVAYNTPYTNYIIWVQYLPQYFNQPYAAHVGYQILIAMSCNFIGYGMAGIVRRFIVYPTYCVWPASLVTIALNSAFHQENNDPVRGPFGSVWRISRIKFFYIMFGAMFVWFWLPGYLWIALSKFSWLSWISPNSTNLNAIVGFNNGLGINPFPTWDWNTLLWDSADPLMVPFFSTINRFLGAFASMWVVLAIWYSNVYNTGYLPINTNRVYDNTGNLYNVTMATDDRGLFDADKYREYSPPFLGAGNVVIYMFFFGVYTSTLTYAILYHRHEMITGFKGLINSFRRKKVEEEQVLDVHHRMMKSYPEVPEWWYLSCLVIAIALGIAAITIWDTHTSPGVVFYGLALCLVFVIPVGIIKAMTGIEVTLNVIAEFIGGSFVEGNALAMNYFKSFGYVTCAHAVWFANDLKLAHYVKIPPRQTFMAQMVATFVGTLVCVGVLNFQMRHIDGVCTPDAQFRLTCPGVNTFFTASVLWGTVGPTKIWGENGQYTETLIGFPLGVIIVVFFFILSKKFPNLAWTRQIHPVAIMYGGIVWAPYNMSYIWPSVPIAYISWIYLKSRFLGMWSKYNFVLSAAWSCGIAIAGVIIFFTLQWTGVELEWWGNDVAYEGCEGSPCTLKTLGPGEYFGPRRGNFK